jgi:hypothetical protein
MLQKMLIYYGKAFAFESHEFSRIDCASVRPSVMFVTSNRPSDNTHVHLIRVNSVLTLDKVKMELLSPRWLPHGCHVGWMYTSFHYIVGAGAHTT